MLRPTVVSCFILKVKVMDLIFLFISGPSLIQYLDSLPPVSRMSEGPVRLPIVDRYKVSSERVLKLKMDLDPAAIFI